MGSPLFTPETPALLTSTSTGPAGSASAELVDTRVVHDVEAVDAESDAGAHEGPELGRVFRVSGGGIDLLAPLRQLLDELEPDTPVRTGDDEPHARDISKSRADGEGNRAPVS